MSTRCPDVGIRLASPWVVTDAPSLKIPRISMIHKARKTLSTSRLPRVSEGVVVIESDGSRCRAVSAVRGQGRAHIGDPVGCDAPLTAHGLHSLASRLGSPYSDVLLVVPDAVPRTVFESRTSSEPGCVRSERESTGHTVSGWALDSSRVEELRFVQASLDRRQRDDWREALQAAGLRLEGVYPLVGTPLAGIDSPRDKHPRLVLQVERGATALIEALGSSCMAVDIQQGPPTIERCRNLLGADCPEVTLCGGGAELSDFGYRLVRSSRTWVRFPTLRGTGAALDPSMAALVGAANHAFGFVHADATACIPPG